MTTEVKLHKTLKPTQQKPKRQVWLARYWTAEGRRKGKVLGVVGDMSKRDAERAARKLQAEFDTGDLPIDDPAKLRLCELVALFIEANRMRLQPRSIQQYEQAAKYGYAALGKDTLISKLDQGTATRLIRHLGMPKGDKKRRLATIGKILSKWRAILTWAHQQGMLHKNPMIGLKLAKVQPRHARVFSRDEIARIIDVAPDLYWRCMLSVMFQTGMRVSEIAHLHWTDFDADPRHPKLSVTAKRASRFKLDGETFPILEYQSKTHTNRTIPIPHTLRDLLQRLRKDSDATPYIFMSLERMRALDARQQAGKLRENFEPVNNVRRTFRNTVRRALGDDAALGTPHDARVSYLTHMAEIVNAKKLQSLAGHSNVSTTLTYYTRTTDTQDAAIRDVFDRIPDTLQTLSPNLKLADAGTDAA